MGLRSGMGMPANRVPGASGMTVSGGIRDARDLVVLPLLVNPGSFSFAGLPVSRLSAIQYKLVFFAGPVKNPVVSVPSTCMELRVTTFWEG